MTEARPADPDGCAELGLLAPSEVAFMVARHQARRREQYRRLARAALAAARSPQEPTEEQRDE